MMVTTQAPIPTEQMENGRYLTQSYSKSRYTNRKSPKSKVTTQTRPQNFDNTKIADRLRAVNWSNDSHTTGVGKPVYGILNFPLTTKAV